ncbi:MAG: Coenzyme F420 hydrogenase/dehydrogenase, beta subunit C-terminal domain [Candidatus Bathyarchaeia archaeon]
MVAKSSEGKPFFPVPSFATTAEEILQSAGTKYFYSPNILALAEAVEQNKKCIAFVGTPCHIRAIRKMQLAGLKKYVDSLKLLIGLMCFKCFNYEGLMENYICGKLGINPNYIRGIKIIKGKMYVTLNMKTLTIPLAEAKQYVRKNCHFCQDFSSEFADISAGGLGLKGWAFLIIRTEKGKELVFDAARAGKIEIRNANEEPKSLEMLVRLSRKKASCN